MKEKIIKGLKACFRSFIWLGVLLLALDIITKQVIMANNVGLGNTIADWGIVRINYVLNRGAAFGMGTGNETANRVIYLIVACVISLGLGAYLVIKRKQTKLFFRACFIMIITGAIGNMIDRIFYGPLQNPDAGMFGGYVVDWIDFWWFWQFNFNIADCCIVIAAIMLIVYILVGEVKESIKNRNKEITGEKVLSKTEQEIEEHKSGKDDTDENIGE